MLVGSVHALMKKRADGDAKKEYFSAVICAAIYGITNIVVDFIWSVGELILLGSAPAAAITAELTSIPATMINAVFTVIGISLLYMPVTSAYRRVGGR